MQPTKKGLLAPYLLGPGLEAEESVSHNCYSNPIRGFKGRAMYTLGWPQDHLKFEKIIFIPFIKRILN